MKILDIGKLIEKKGFWIITGTFVVMLFVSCLIFYFYALRSIDYAQNLGFGDIGINKNVLEDVLRDLDSRESDLNKLKREPINVQDIFR